MCAANAFAFIERVTSWSSFLFRFDFDLVCLILTCVANVLNKALFSWIRNLLFSKIVGRESDFCVFNNGV